VNAEYRSIRGTIKVRWKREAQAFTLEVTIPANVDAVVYLPAKEAGEVTEGGRPVKVGHFADGRAEVHVESGTYRFRTAL
jgi:alpha-L-rhamnosidase